MWKSLASQGQRPPTSPSTPRSLRLLLRASFFTTGSFCNSLEDSYSFFFFWRTHILTQMLERMLYVWSKLLSRGFPGGAVVGSLPADAGNTCSSPGLGGSHMPRSDRAREPQLLSLRVWSLCSATRGAAMVRGLRAHRDEEWPPLAATGESPRTETKTQHSQK